MTTDEIKSVVIEELKRIAPEVDAASLSPDANLRDEIDLDSMDVLNFALALHQRLCVEIPETDYSRLWSLTSAVDHLRAKLSLVR